MRDPVRRTPDDIPRRTLRAIALACALSTVPLGAPCLAGDGTSKLAPPSVSLGRPTLDRDVLARSSHPEARRSTVSLDGTPGTRLEAAVPSDVSFLDRHLVPRLSRRFANLAGTHPLAVLGLGPGAGNAHADLASLAAGDAESAARSAVGDWAVEAFSIEMRVDRWLAGRLGSLGSHGRADGGVARSRGPRVSFGVSHSLPSTDLTWTVGRRSSLRVKLRTHGAAGLEWRRGGETAHRLYAGWDGGRDRVHVQYRRSF